MAKPQFTHIHSSSRYDRPAADLERALDGYMAHSSLVTLTEVASGQRRATLAESGWGYYCASQPGTNSDDCAICWQKSVWTNQQNWVKKLYGSWHGLTQVLNGLWSCSSLLKHNASGQKLLVSVCHMPAHVEGYYSNQHWRHADGPRANEFWRERKVAYTTSMGVWSTHVKDLSRKKKPDAILISADWNVNLKDDWFRAFVNQHWGSLGMRLGWKHFPSAGGSMGGDRIIDGSFYSGLTTDGARLMPPNPSSDHRPYTETYTLTGGAQSVGPVLAYDPATGMTRRGIEWWGFGDYTYDEYYEQVHTLADGSTVVTFDFDDENVPYY